VSAGDLWRYRWPLALAACLTVVETLMDLAKPWPLLLAIDHAIGGQPLGEPWAAWLRLVPDGRTGLAAVAALSIVALAVSRALVAYLAMYLSDASAERIGADLRALLHARLLRLSLRFHHRQRTGDLAARLTTDVGRVQDALVASFATVVPEVLTLVGMAAVLLVIDPALALAALAVLPPLALVVFLRRRRLRAAQLDYRDREGRLAAGVTESMRNIGLIQAFGLEPPTRRRFGDHNRATAMSGMAVVELNARYQPTADVIIAIGSALVLWAGVTQVISGRITLGMLVVVVSYVASLYAPIRALARLSAAFGKAAASRSRLSEIVACDEVVPEVAGAPAIVGIEHDLALRSVSFAYSGDRPVLHRVSLSVPAGATCCIVGPTGAGKSTLLSLILRLYDPDEGSIEVDGRDLRTVDLRSVRRRMALVPQEPAIFDGSLRENIAIGAPEAGDAAVRRAARLAQLDEFAARLPAGYDTQVGEGGVLLSGGQRRRLAIARALVRQAPVLLLDEPTSGLDVESEALVMGAIRGASAGRTVVVVTHRLALAAVADQVAVLRGGRIVEQGTPAELLRQGGQYARLWDIHAPAARARAPAQAMATAAASVRPDTMPERR
jgi:ABC-type multidrug transport system fused ATPase/permease subunit